MRSLIYAAGSIALMLQLSSCAKKELGTNNQTPNEQATTSSQSGQNALSTNSVPSDIINLAPWKLSIPVDASGGNTGAATTIDSTHLKAGYTSSYFYTSSDNGIVFWCPTDGATTTPGSGSNHPRTELQEYRQWALADKGKLQSTLVVNKHPTDTNDIIIGQIHGGGTNNSAPFVMLHLNKGVIEAVIKQSLTQSVYHKQNLITGVASGDKIYYSIYSNGNNIYFNTSNTPPGGTTTSATWQDTIPSDFKQSGVVVHFAAGDYVQSHTPNDGLFPNSTIGGKVTMYSLVITHY